jgi:hypothetical protein
VFCNPENTVWNAKKLHQMLMESDFSIISGFLWLACDSGVLRGVIVLQDHRVGRRFCVAQIEKGLNVPRAIRKPTDQLFARAFLCSAQDSWCI